MKVKKLLDIAAGKKLPMLACNEYLAKVGLCSASYLTREVDKNLSGGEVKRMRSPPSSRATRSWPSTTSPRRASTCGASTA